MNHNNKIIYIKTNYIKEDNDLTKCRPYFVLKNNENSLVLLAISSIKSSKTLSVTTIKINKEDSICSNISKDSKLDMRKQIIIQKTSDNYNSLVYWYKENLCNNGCIKSEKYKLINEKVKTYWNRNKLRLKSEKYEIDLSIHLEPCQNTKHKHYKSSTSLSEEFKKGTKKSNEKTSIISKNNKDEISVIYDKKE